MNACCSSSSSMKAERPFFFFLFFFFFFFEPSSLSTTFSCFSSFSTFDSFTYSPNHFYDRFSGQNCLLHSMVSLKYIAFIDIIRCWIGLIKPISYQVCLAIFDVGRSGCRSALAFDSNMRRGGRDSPPSQLTETPCHSNLSDAHTKS